MDHKLTATAYIRVSTEEQKQGHSIETQKSTISKYCEQRGITINEVLSDEGMSGAAGVREREEFKKLLYAKSHIIVVFAIDRISRDMLTLLLFAKHLIANGQELHTITSGKIELDTGEGMLLYTAQALIADIQRRNIVHRTQAAMDYLKTEGKVRGSVPYGFTRDGNDLKENPSEKRVIDIANKMYHNGANLTAIKNRLKHMDIKPRSGGKWYTSQIKRMIPTYVRTHSRFNRTINYRKLIEALP